MIGWLGDNAEAGGAGGVVVVCAPVWGWGGLCERDGGGGGNKSEEDFGRAVGWDSCGLASAKMRLWYSVVRSK